jgi:O-acetyl-ADP-ribose deacetylase (regulator of RNase III)
MDMVIDGVRIECVQGNVVEQPDIDTIVNAANAWLAPGGGVAGAIHRAAGPGLAEECRPLAPIRPGEADITGAHRLPNKHVIHCLGPMYSQRGKSLEMGRPGASSPGRPTQNTEPATQNPGLWPVYGVDVPSAVLLASCYRYALKLAEEHHIPSVAFPAISTGIFGYPVEEATRVALSTVLAEAPHLSSLKLIRFVLFSQADLDVCKRLLSELVEM